MAHGFQKFDLLAIVFCLLSYIGLFQEEDKKLSFLTTPVKIYSKVLAEC
jgi:hypothetical protein